MPAQWWLLFDDPLLAEMQSGLREGNLDLHLASERIEQSRALLGIASSQVLPSVELEAGQAYEAISKNGKFAALGAPTSASDFWRVAFDARWEIDLWGRAQREREGAQAMLEAAAYDREAAEVALSAEVARTYLQLRGTQAQIATNRQGIAVAERLLALANSRERNGITSRFETSSSRAQLATVKAIGPELVQRRNTLMNALSLLLGEKPRALDDRLIEALPLPEMPSHMPVGVPSELAQRRPDIQRAESLLRSATAAIGVAKADFYPRIGLSGRIGVEAFDIGDLGWDSRFFSVGPTIYLPIFEGGRLRQRLALSEARQKSAALVYRQTVLQAWHEVDTALDAWAAQKRRHAELKTAYEQNRLGLQIAERGYQEGALSYIEVLTAQRAVLLSQSDLNVSATNATLTIVNLYKSLGGGWHTDSIKTSLPVKFEQSNATPLTALGSKAAQ